MVLAGTTLEGTLSLGLGCQLSLALVVCLTLRLCGTTLDSSLSLSYFEVMWH